MTSPLTCHHGIAKARGCSHIAVGTFSHLFPDLAPLPITEAEAAAQFVDQDVTLDVSNALGPAPGSAQATDVKGFVKKALGDVCSAGLDLDCVYGFGPEGSPHLYDGDHLAVHPNGFDLARKKGQ